MSRIFYIFMGVSGCGKTTYGDKLAKYLNCKFLDGDDLHPKANIQKMQNGIPLNDKDREIWLERLSDFIYSSECREQRAVIACSALKKSYRDYLRKNSDHIIFIYLSGDKELIKNRLMQRNGHYMKDDLLNSQFSTLEEPCGENDVIKIDIIQDKDEIINTICNKVKDYEK